jgi:hypothetical protein
VVARDTRFEEIVDVAENEAPIEKIMERANPNENLVPGEVSDSQGKT